MANLWAETHGSSDRHGLMQLIFMRLRRALTRLAVISMVIQTGCATTSPPPVPSMEVRQRLGMIAIVPAQYAPRTNFAAFAKSKPAGVARGAALGGAGGTLVAAAATNPYTAILIQRA